MDRADDRQRDEGAEAAPHARTARRRWLLPMALAALGVVAVAATLGLTRRSSSSASPSPRELAATIGSVVDERLQAAKQQPPDAALVYQAIVPSLVVVRTDGSTESEQSLGSGVVINAQGAILTADHVIDGARSIKVTFADGTTSPARVVTQQPEHDIAVLRAEQLPEVLVPAVLGGGVQVGDAAFAVGHPLGLTASLSAGVISGLNRTVPVPSGRTLEGLIQFDASVNPGSSGGPLLNRGGQVVGIVTALASPQGRNSFNGIGFAVPIGTAGGAAGGPEQ